MAAMIENKGVKAPAFKKPDISAFVPPDAKDAVDRIVAAGMKIMYSPDMKDEVQEAITGKGPVSQRMAANVTGLIALLDQKAAGKTPVGALFPAALELLGEAAEIMSAAKVDVSQEDYNEAAQLCFVMIGKKLGGTDEQITQSLSQMGGQGEPAAPAASAAPATPTQGAA